MLFTFTSLVWIGFFFLIIAVVTLDLGVFHRKPHVVSVPESIAWTCVWVSLALAFNVVIYYLYELNPAGWDMDTEQLTGAEASLNFFTGYLVEKSLSIDNIFVIALVFVHFQVPQEQQHRVLFWGILGAVVLRAIMIFAGVAVIERFEWLVYILGLLLLGSAASMLVSHQDNIAPQNNFFIRLIKRYYPVTTEFHGSHFFIVQNGVRAATPLFLALILVETSDVMFAIDSIPAIFAITQDPFIIFTSNVFAILGLRSLYFLLAGLMQKFRYLKISLAFLLAFIGVKMMLVHSYPIPSMVSLAIIGGILFVGILASTKTVFDIVTLLSPLADEFESLVSVSYRQARRAAVLLLSCSVIIACTIVFIMPGPPWLVILSVLVILTLLFVWAGRALNQFRKRLQQS
ncbi:MAG: tellurite resistance protein TerC [Pseudohongiellaceae bacterium]|jgi:tellurite resistance protein TerC